MEQEKRRSGIATEEQLERRLTRIAMGRMKDPKPPTTAEQLKAAEMLLKLRGRLEPEAQPGPMEVRIRVLEEGAKPEPAPEK